MKSFPKFRVESRVRKSTSSETPCHYLIREFWVNGKRQVIARYIKSESSPTDTEIDEFIKKNIEEIERVAQEKYIQTRLSSFQTRFLSEETACTLEKVRYLYQYMKNIMPVDEVDYYESTAEYHYIHGTTSVEGNTFSYSDTVNLLDHGVIPSGKSAREVFEIVNYKKVAAYRNSYKGRLNFSFIKHLHKIIMDNILVEPGQFRMSDGFVISGCDHQLTPSLLIEDELQALIDKYYADIESGCNPFECALMFHYGFEAIHPFVDGNGRVGREIMNYLLTKNGYPRLLVLKENRADYLSALKSGNNDEFSLMLETFAEISIAQRLETLEKNVERGIWRMWELSSV